MLRATTACTFSTSEPPKVARTCGVLYILTWKCASRHNGVHFLNIRTSKSGANMWCFVHFDLEMCFAPQRRALFDISTSKSGPTMVCFVHFDLDMCFAPQRRALFRHLNFQKSKVVRTWCVLYILTWKCASRHNGVQFSSLIWPAGSAPAALASLLFDSPEPQIIGKTQCFATFLPFRASASSFDSFSSDLLSSNLSLLSASSLLCFSSVHIVGSLTSKLPSTCGVSSGLWSLGSMSSVWTADLESNQNYSTRNDDFKLKKYLLWFGHWYILGNTHVCISHLFCNMCISESK